MAYFSTKTVFKAILGLTCLGGGLLAPTAAWATTLTGFSTFGNTMGGMEVRLGLMDGTTSTAIWSAQNSRAEANGWSLALSGNTFTSPWRFSYTGPSAVHSLWINAIAGNTVFDLFPDERTPTSSEGHTFEVISGLAPSSYIYQAPINIANWGGDLYGILSMTWDQGFWGQMRFRADTDSGTTSDPVKAVGPIPTPPVPPQPPTLLDVQLSNLVIYEGQSPTVTLFGHDPNGNPLTFFLQNQAIGTPNTTSGQATVQLPVYTDEQQVTLSAFVQDSTGSNSNVLQHVLTVLNVAPQITQLTSNLLLSPGQSFDFFATATDPGINDILTYRWDLNGDGIFDDFIGSQGQWAFNQAGTHLISVQVDDGDGGFTTQSFKVSTLFEPDPEDPRESQSIPEPSTLASLIAMGLVGATLKGKHKTLRNCDQNRDNI